MMPLGSGLLSFYQDSLPSSTRKTYTQSSIPSSTAVAVNGAQATTGGALLSRNYGGDTSEGRLGSDVHDTTYGEAYRNRQSGKDMRGLEQPIQGGGGYPNNSANQSPANLVRSNPAPNISFNSFPSQPQDGSQNRGLFSPGLGADLAAMRQQSLELLAQPGIAANWRGRQLAKFAQRQVQNEVGLAGARAQQQNADSGQLVAQSSALRASNEVPLALLSDYTHQRGQDIQLQTANQADATHRYGIDTGAATAKYGADAGLAVHLPTLARDTMINEQIADGNAEGAHRLAAIGKQDLRPIPPHVSWDPSGRFQTTTHADGRVVQKTAKQIAMEAELSAKQARDEAAAADAARKAKK